jgi:DNA repair protein RadA/Sms
MSKMNLQVGIKGLKTGTNILDVKVPDQLRVRLKTGISWFDDALGGEGFAASSVMMLTGTPGAGKTTMLLQLADAITAAGNICLYNTGEESLYQVKMVAERLKLKHGFVCGQDTLCEDVIKHANALAKANPGKKVFILADSLQTLDDGKWADGTNSMTAVRVVEMLTDWAKSTFNVVVFIGQVTKDGTFAGKMTIKHAVDVHGHIFIDDQKKSETYGERLFEVQKNRWGCSGRTYVLGIKSSGLYEKGNFEKAAA